MTLLDVHHAVERESVFALLRHPPSACCPAGRRTHRPLGRIFREAETALEGSLAEVTIADVSDAVISGRGQHVDALPPAGASHGRRRRIVTFLRHFRDRGLAC